MADKSNAQAKYWQNQITAAEKDTRLTNWLKFGQNVYDRYLLESKGLTMGGLSMDGARSPMIYNLLWSNVQTYLPMLYSRAPEPYIARRFGNRDPIARMAATISERAVVVDMERDDFDSDVEAALLDYLIVGRGTLRGIYETTIINSRITVQEVDREEGEPAFVTEQGLTIPGEAVEKDRRGLFMLDPQIRDERAPLLYHFWKDFLVGPGRNWKEVTKRGWIDYICYLSKADASKRFGKDVANRLSYTYSPLDMSKDDPNKSTEDTQHLQKLARVDEIWCAKTRKVYWTSPGFPGMLDEQEDMLDLEGFFNTPRPLLRTTGNESLVPVPDYAEYRTQAAEMDQITAKIEILTEEIRGGGIYDNVAPGLGNFLRNKGGEWKGVDNWERFASQGGLEGSMQQFNNAELIKAVAGLYEHRRAVKRDADEIEGMIDLFRGQQTQDDETLGQSEIRSGMGGLRINEKQREVQRYLRDALQIKTEIMVTHFDDNRLLEMADAQALIGESSEVSQLQAIQDSPQGQQAQQAAMMGNPQAMQMVAQFTQALQQAVGKQRALIQQALALLKSDRMRTFRLNIETDSTVAIDEATEKAAANEFVRVMGELLTTIGSADIPAPLKGPVAQTMMFLVRRYHVGRSLEQQWEEAIKTMVTAPEPQPQPDPLSLDIQRQAAKDQADAQTDQQKLEIDRFKAQTDRMEADADVAEAASKSTRESLKLVDEITKGDTVGNA